MKKYGCSNIDDLIDELKKLRIGNKELQKLLGEYAGIIDNQRRREKDINEERDNANDKCKKLQEEIERLNKTIEYMDD